MGISEKLTEALSNRYELEKWKANVNVAINQGDGSYFNYKFSERKLLTVATLNTAGTVVHRYSTTVSVSKSIKRPLSLCPSPSHPTHCCPFLYEGIGRRERRDGRRTATERVAALSCTKNQRQRLFFLSSRVMHGAYNDKKQTHFKGISPSHLVGPSGGWPQIRLVSFSTH